MKPATIPTHLPQPRPARLRKAGLHAIERRSYAFGSASEQLQSARAHTGARAAAHAAPANTPGTATALHHCGASASGTYDGRELQRNAGLPAGRFAAFALPSRVGRRLYYPDGRVEEVAP